MIISKILNSKEEKQLGFKLREEVFILEQNVPEELELDALDNLETTIHVGIFENNSIIGVGRILDIDKPIVHFGRIAIKKTARGRNLGEFLIKELEKITLDLNNNSSTTVKLGAQFYAEKFYSKLGYSRVNDNIYTDAGIEHIDMKKVLCKTSS